MACTTLLYVHLAVPNHWRRVFFCSVVGYSLILSDFAAGSFSELSSFGCSHSVVLGDEVVDDREEVVGKLVLGILVVLEVNHELCSGFVKDEFDQLNAVSADAIFVGNTHFADISAVDAVQKGFKLGPVVVEAASDFGDDFVCRVGCMKIGDLALKIGALLGAADSCIADFRFFPLCAKELVDVISVVEALPARTPNATDFVVVGPSVECATTDSVGTLDISPTLIDCFVHESLELKILARRKSIFMHKLHQKYYGTM
jgi:hypothetical protein